jgi:hypothetical protein
MRGLGNGFRSDDHFENDNNIYTHIYTHIYAHGGGIP